MNIDIAPKLVTAIDFAGKVDGVTALKQIKADPELHKMPVIILTTTEDL